MDIDKDTMEIVQFLQNKRINWAEKECGERHINDDNDMGSHEHQEWDVPTSSSY